MTFSVAIFATFSMLYYVSTEKNPLSLLRLVVNWIG